MTEAPSHGPGRSDHALDPAPRHYPAMVSLLRRARFDRATLPSQDPAGVEAWLLGDAIRQDDLLALVQAFLWRLVAAGLPVQRASLHVGTLHPQLFGYAWNWNSDDGFCDEVKVDEAALVAPAYRANPLFRAIEHHERFRTRPAATDASPLLRELAGQGFTDYAVLPLNAGAAQHHAATLATRQADGFSDAQFAALDRLLRVFALHVERHIASRIARNLVTTYLGAAAGQLVLDGAIRRGAGRAIDAILWVSDLRGFTTLAERLEDRAVTAVLDLCFDRLAGAVMDAGGEVLKFIGDGMLAVFPVDRPGGERAAAGAAIAAAEAALRAFAALNADPAQAPGWAPMQVGIALHRGEAFFGNVGSPRRLDFTVIGRAVNAASRVEGLCKETGRSLLITGPVAALTERALEPLGEHRLRGVAGPVALHALPGW